MSEEKTTTVVVSMPVWRKLTKMRQTPQDSFDVVLRRLLKIDESSDPAPDDKAGSDRKGCKEK